MHISQVIPLPFNLAENLVRASSARAHAFLTISPSPAFLAQAFPPNRCSRDSFETLLLLKVILR